MPRDIKVENLFLSSTGELKLGDFGLALNVALERPTARVGTLDYMSPEVSLVLRHILMPAVSCSGCSCSTADPCRRLVCMLNGPGRPFAPDAGTMHKGHACLIETGCPRVNQRFTLGACHGIWDAGRQNCCCNCHHHAAKQHERQDGQCIQNCLGARKSGLQMLYLVHDFSSRHRLRFSFQIQHHVLELCL